MADPLDIEDDDIAPSDKDPAEGAPEGQSSAPAPHVPSHLGPAGDPAEGA